MKDSLNSSNKFIFFIYLKKMNVYNKCHQKKDIDL